MPSNRTLINALLPIVVLTLIGVGAGSLSAEDLAASLTLTLAPSTVVGGTASEGTITLLNAAPAGGLIVTVTNPPGTTVQAGAARVGIQSEGTTKIAIAEGARSITFRVNTAGVASLTVATLTATSGADVSSATLTLLPPSVQSVTVTPTSVVSGNSSTGKVTLNGPAPAQGIVVPLFASNTSVTLPSSVTISLGNRDQTFQITSSAATAGSTVTISTRRVREAASRISDGTSNTIVLAEAPSGGVSATLNLLPASVIASFTLRPTQVKGGSNVVAEILLIPSATSAQTLTFSTDRPDVVQLPASISVAASPVATPLTITTHDVTAKVTATITATAGSQSIPVVLTIKK